MKKTINKITREDIASYKEDGHAHGHLSSLAAYQEIATKSAIYPGQGTPLGLAYVALKLNGEAGEFAEHVGKAMRDDDLIEWQHEGQNGEFSGTFMQLTDARRDLLIKEAGDVLWYLSAICNELDLSLSDVALQNLEKLCDRGERDALQGSGDLR